MRKTKSRMSSWCLTEVHEDLAKAWDMIAHPLPSGGVGQCLERVLNTRFKHRSAWIERLIPFNDQKFVRDAFRQEHMAFLAAQSK